MRQAGLQVRAEFQHDAVGGVGGSCCCGGAAAETMRDLRVVTSRAAADSFR